MIFTIRCFKFVRKYFEYFKFVAIMFKLYPLVSECAIRLVDCFKNEIYTSEIY